MKRIGIGTLLRKNISKGQLVGYSLANLVGLTVILSGILFYCDSRHHQKNDDKFFSDDYIVITKKVNGISLDPVAFTEHEIKELKEENWVKKLGKFTSGDFSVSASVNMGGKGMSTYLFFESVPDDFFDVKPRGWEFDPEKRFIPIVLNKDYLALYNFGFALPQGLPQLSEDMIGSVPLRLIISGKNGRSEIFDASVVGFSSRLNTIAVPENFINWANERFSDNNSDETARLIIKLDRLNSGNYENFLKERNYEIAGDKDGDSKISEFLGLISGITAATGFIISILALFILLLSISLLLQKSRIMLNNLMLLGYSPKFIGLYYNKMVISINLVITLIAIGLTFVCRLIWHKTLISLGLGDGNVLFMLGAALLYFCLVSFVNLNVVRNHMISIWKNR